jgi:hypothetical protein
VVRKQRVKGRRSKERKQWQGLRKKEREYIKSQERKPERRKRESAKWPKCLCSEKFPK